MPIDVLTDFVEVSSTPSHVNYTDDNGNQVENINDIDQIGSIILVGNGSFIPNLFLTGWEFVTISASSV